MQSGTFLSFTAHTRKSVHINQPLYRLPLATHAAGSMDKETVLNETCAHAGYQKMCELLRRAPFRFREGEITRLQGSKSQLRPNFLLLNDFNMFLADSRVSNTAIYRHNHRDHNDEQETNDWSDGVNALLWCASGCTEISIVLKGENVRDEQTSH